MSRQGRRLLRSGWLWLLIPLLGLHLLATADFLASRALHTMQSRYGDEGVALLQAWNRLMTLHQHSSEQEQLAEINDFFNRNIRFGEDTDLWGQSDYWATPLETLGLRAGDCEDYTIAKYLSLLKLGIPQEKLRLIYVRASIGGAQSRVSQAHMVLGYYESPEALPLILDNLVSRILPADQRPDLKPVFSFNSFGLWVGNNPESQADPTARLSRWRDVLTRMQQEGFYE